MQMHHVKIAYVKNAPLQKGQAKPLETGTFRRQYRRYKTDLGTNFKSSVIFG